MKCPKCGSHDIRIECIVICEIFKPENVTSLTAATFVPVSGYFANWSSHALCNDCEFEGKARLFLDPGQWTVQQCMTWLDTDRGIDPNTVNLADDDTDGWQNLVYCELEIEIP